MQVNAIVCKGCGDTVYSRARHDMHFCTCGLVAIDGGREYVKLCGEPENYKLIKLEVKATNKQLVDDWNYQINKYGLIKGTKHAKHGTASRRRKSRASLIV